MAKITEGTRVKAGRKGTDSYDTGTVHEIADGRAFVGWDSGVATWIDLTQLRRLA